ncbi:LacI family DNA-binding transcriptional regulator [Parafrankia sp. EUN1f]|uniref:LacI family DNA-binding transcriptional regulator n=1 Tax=Parafrankia sp. EUN1f TaxID=102897 RepID=UPI0001C441E7|nr:LacI family DNA-binding transcriptional regulator [Parafrankia sp. EUN1f]EFC86066.1 transcriptional regulator, LacI family [Parafrankia sp. EUN1f]
MRKSATISDVAELAGVSRATVSRVVNGLPTVAPEIVERVTAAIAELDYHPSTLARNLSLGSTRTIAVVVPDLENPMFQSVLRGVTRAAAGAGYRVLVADTEEHAEVEAEIATEARRRCDALVLCAPRMPDAPLRQLLPKLEPVVLINRDAPDLGVPVVGVDYAAGARALLEHLVELGHRDIAYLSGPPGSTSDSLRRDGFARALTRSDHIELRILPTGARIEDGHRVAPAFVALGCTAAMAFNDLVAFGLLTGLREAGVDVPLDVSVAGFDDIPFAAYATPPLTTAAVAQFELGAQAWQHLHDAVSGAAPAAPFVHQPEIVVRASTATARMKAATAPTNPAGVRV